jgi:hypothetical protein
MIEIVNGPTERSLVKASDRKRVIFELKDHSTRQFSMIIMKQRDESRHLFDFKTEAGDTGFYDAKLKKGEIHPPTISTTSEATPAIEV